MRTRTRRRCLRALPLVLAGLGCLACGDGGAAELEKLQARLDEAQAESEALQKGKSELESKVAELSSAAEELGGELEETKSAAEELAEKTGALEGELKKKEAVVATLAAVQSELGKALVDEVEAGDIRVSKRRGLLVVDVSDKVLFDTGKAEVKEKGKALLDKLAESLKKLPSDTVFQVGGHTDNQPIKSVEVKERFPTNWELSAARATQVVRHLQEVGGIPGKRLIAAGFSQYRPVAKNKKSKGRKKNRRIEISLIPNG